ncbi:MULTISPECIES: hypothetical protein [unclassified Arthrobacter]|uniref:hypothetical protein n=1 Tax=unclassified Arthrobacter TaxID=235627 RepID=UPI001491EB9D|nr:MULTISPECIES: hypothetical protein [unclassified Arthrobacter]MBE0008510.1 hypothetical protein [Arthrobacter sp. AET 35A]NOJ59258.1 hypothetical protein [Arthrobacter sp. 260]NOJ62250.1 hypothetical protein [Arthrobacter sp. 147(2020)]
MPTLLSTTSPIAPEPGATTQTGATRRHGEFIMAGSLTAAGDPEQIAPGTPATVMPNYAHREEVQIMLKKLRDGVSLWKRIPNAPPDSARESVSRFVLPQHTMHIK